MKKLNPKTETRNPKQIQIYQILKLNKFCLNICDLGFSPPKADCLEFSIWDLEFSYCKQENLHGH